MPTSNHPSGSATIPPGGPELAARITHARAELADYRRELADMPAPGAEWAPKLAQVLGELLELLPGEPVTSWEVAFYSGATDTDYVYFEHAATPRAALDQAWARHMAEDGSRIDAIDVERQR
jgi:hypothetical protein